MNLDILSLLGKHTPYCRHVKVNLITTILLIRVHHCNLTVSRSKQFHMVERSTLVCSIPQIFTKFFLFLFLL